MILTPALYPKRELEPPRSARYVDALAVDGRVLVLVTDLVYSVNLEEYSPSTAECSVASICE